mgnify:CR=1 FL=1
MSLTEYALTFLHQPYRWGGSNPLTGYDCSGLVIEILKSIGICPFSDGSAQALYNHFRTNGTQMGVRPGALCFYGKNAMGITHIGFMINQNQILEAGAGDSTTVSLERAESQGACVRLRPYMTRKDLVEIISPIYPKWVML